jgi:hypothetical protein
MIYDNRKFHDNILENPDSSDAAWAKSQLMQRGLQFK